MLYPSTTAVYLGTVISSIEYTISFPALYLSNPVNDHAQFSLAVTVLSVTFVPSANKFTVMLSGLVELSKSTHVLLPNIAIFSGVCVFVILYPFTSVV